MERMTFSRTPDGQLALDGKQFDNSNKLLFARMHGPKLRPGDAGPESLVRLASNDLNHEAHRLSFGTGRDLSDCIKHLMAHSEMRDWYALGRLHPQPDDKFSSLVTFEAR